MIPLIVPSDREILTVKAKAWPYFSDSYCQRDMIAPQQIIRASISSLKKNALSIML